VAAEVKSAVGKQMSKQEAQMILGVEPSATWEEVAKVKYLYSSVFLHHAANSCKYCVLASYYISSVVFGTLICSSTPTEPHMLSNMDAV
jgi:hypothetical protein